ncbi:MAG: flagellar biosynthesis anti-sigma factor FlgM [Chloroflexi bacterium]|nr:MAG: flagellar biosynthesis anti-sigma factor FlgM [Chloroflexota bacterium]MBL1194826.1 flagellar biosynthesis anti-sigma factor FlgM [Chloroflexota bacterium]NOH12117.1 flagellar biosynthesis anti-sigma factor FlgM [Chloroflexota bacterium]
MPKIENTNASQIMRSQANKARQAEQRKDTVGSQRGERSARSDQTALSPRARLLSTARKALESASDVRREKIEAIQQEILDGNYQVDVEELAKRLSSLLES